MAERVRAFVQREIKPNVGRWFENAELPTEIFSKLASEGLFGMHLKGYGCAGLSAPQYGLAMQELEAGDSGICSVFVGLRHYWRRRGCRWG
ncbi:acyl-CoA dehydrogenase family protein [Corynebacterium argentoratense]|nr:acyl-CoA dehydrogenase family protein [Corynebacterium argentoratense]MCF1711239.1 acyl-CoA dehydrogenase family protein [Corynebacterium argentoratense]